MTVRIDNTPTIKSRRHPLDQVCINTIRTLAIDAIQAANSGHPGTPMAMAPVGYYLWQYVLRFDPQDPIWPNRERFVLSAGTAKKPRSGRSAEKRDNQLERQNRCSQGGEREGDPLRRGGPPFGGS